MKARNFLRRVFSLSYWHCRYSGHAFVTDINYPKIVIVGTKRIERFVYNICTHCQKREHKDHHAGGLVICKRRWTLRYGSRYGFGYGWLSRNAQKPIVKVWNWLICPMTGHDWFGDCNPKQGAVHYPNGSFTYVQKICGDCSRIKNESGVVGVIPTEKV